MKSNLDCLYANVLENIGIEDPRYSLIRTNKRIRHGKFSEFKFKNPTTASVLSFSAPAGRQDIFTNYRRLTSKQTLNSAPKNCLYSLTSLV